MVSRYMYTKTPTFAAWAMCRSKTDGVTYLLIGLLLAGASPACSASVLAIPTSRSYFDFMFSPDRRIWLWLCGQFVIDFRQTSRLTMHEDYGQLSLTKTTKQTADLDKMCDRRQDDVVWSTDNARVVSCVFRHNIYNTKQNSRHCCYHVNVSFVNHGQFPIIPKRKDFIGLGRWSVI